jgi:hypothetical protein
MSTQQGVMMSGPIKFMSQRVRRLWASVTSPAPSARPLPPGIVHDRDAKLPRDLDDPFCDRQVQSRMADVIAQAGKKTGDA